MKREELRQRLAEVLEERRNLSFEEAARLSEDPIVEQHGEPGSSRFYQVAFRFLEKVATETESYIHVAVSIDDGHGPLGILLPEMGSLIVHEHGPVERLLPNHSVSKNSDT